MSHEYQNREHEVAVNKPLIDSIIQKFRDDPSCYDQGTFGVYETPEYRDLYEEETPCRTPCCIAGWAINLYRDKDGQKVYHTRDDFAHRDIRWLAAELLGLDDELTEDLFEEFWPRAWIGHYGPPTVTDAIHVLTQIRNGEPPEYTGWADDTQS